MLRLKQFLAFPIYGTAVWLPFVLAQEAGEFAATAALAGLVLIAFVPLSETLINGAMV
jgi:thiol:disulfide interchange protein DsbD